MSSIPYNYGSYMDAKVSMTNAGTVDSGKQMQSPASAGSRGLAKTTQFTNDRTQMQMGNSPIAESMIEIRSILNRIDGVNAPAEEEQVQEATSDRKLLAMVDNLRNEIMEHPGMSNDTKTEVFTSLEEVEQAIQMMNDGQESAVKEDAGEDEKVVDMLRNIKQHLDNHPNMSEHPSLVALDQLADDLESGDKPADYESVKEDDRVEKAMKDMVPSKVTGYYEITDFWKEHTQMWGKDPETVKYEIADWMVDEMKPDNTPEREELTKRAWAIVDDALKNNKDDMTFDDMIDQLKSKGESAVKEDDGDERAIAAMKLARDEGGKEGFDYPQGGKYGYKAERGSGTGAMGTMQVNVTIHNRETDETMYIKDMNYLELEKGDEQETLAMIWDENRDLIQKESADSGELARLKELSGIKEDAGLTDEQKKGLEAIAKKYKDREGGNGDMLAYGYLDVSDTGIPTDGYDKEEMEAYSKKIGVDWREWDGEQSEDFLEQSKITDEMIDDLLKILGQNFMNDSKLQFRAMEYLDSLDNNYEPMPEGDEFDIEEDEDFEEVLGPLGFPEDETELFDAEYRGRKVPLNKPMRGDVKKFKVYVKDPKSGNVKKVNFGHGGTSAKRKTMRIRKSNPKARKSFRARHNCANPGPKTKARYWSCRKW